jgi:SAM-dependent methyltransferase
MPFSVILDDLGSLDLRTRIMLAAEGLGLPRAMLERTCITEADADLLIQAVRRLRPRRLLEVGAFVGVSGTLLAAAAGPGASLTSIDPSFPVATEGEPFGYHDPRGAPEIYGELAAALGLASRVQTVVGYFSRRPHPSTLERPIRQGARPEIIAVVGARLWPTFQMIFLDGDHHRESVLSDIERAARLLAPGGEVVLHDCEGGGWAVEVLAAYHPFASPPCPPLSFYLHAHECEKGA